MKIQKLIFSAALVFAGILLFAKTARLKNTNTEISEKEGALEKVTENSALKVVWHNSKGEPINDRLSDEHKMALSYMPYAAKDQYHYDFETKTLTKKLYAKMQLKKIWRMAN